jgi:alanyl aminopeptidase
MHSRNGSRPLVLSIFILSAACAWRAPWGRAAEASAASLEATEQAALAGQLASGDIVRLPDDVRPLAYRLKLNIDPNQATFVGSVTLTLRLQKPRQTLYLHGRDLKVGASWASHAGAKPQQGHYEQLNDDGFAAVHFDSVLPAGDVSLELVYEGSFAGGLDGLYRVGMATDGGPYVVSQFEPTSARAAFPCLDEPRFKAPFEVSLVVPTDMTAISNMPSITEQQSSEELQHKQVSFVPSPPLPTYLVAIMVGRFDVVNGPSVPADGRRTRDTPVRGVAAKGQGAKLSYALQHTPRLVQILENYFDLALPFPKLDIIAVPDFAAGAMENPGAITFRDWLLLIDPQLSSRRQKVLFASVMAHELVHQWFGDYVTMSFWDDLWLNESFASWLGERTAATFDPSVRQPETSVLARNAALSADMLPSVRSIRQPVRRPADIDGAFDVTTYLKGGAVLNMFDGYLGSTRVARGLALHLARYRFGNADANALLDSLSRGSGTDVTAAFNSFLNQPGAPTLHASLSCSGGKGTLNLEQSRYTPLGIVSDRTGLWQVPVCWRMGDAHGGSERRCHLLRGAEETVELSYCPTWLFPNADATGYYHFTVDRQIEEGLRHAKLSSPESMAWQSAQTAAFAAGKLRAHDLFHSFRHTAGSSDLYVAATPLPTLQRLADNLLAGDLPAQTSLRRLVRSMYAPQMKSISIKPTAQRTPTEDMVWPQLVSQLTQLRALEPAFEQALVKAGTAYIGYLGDGRLHPEGINVDFAPEAIASAANALGTPYVDAVLLALEKTDNATQRALLVNALGRLRHPQAVDTLRNRLLSLPLRQNELVSLVSAPMADPLLRRSHWQWLTDHFSTLLPRLPRKGLVNLPRVGAGFCTEQDAAMVQAFFTPQLAKLGGAERELAQTLESVRLCAAQYDAHQADLKAELRSR